jgi:hypothetical protein
VWGRITISVVVGKVSGSKLDMMGTGDSTGCVVEGTCCNVKVGNFVGSSSVVVFEGL